MVIKIIVGHTDNRLGKRDLIEMRQNIKLLDRMKKTERTESYWALSKRRYCDEAFLIPFRVKPDKSTPT